MRESIGRYRVERLLGRGGMGEVYKALDPSLQRHVAVKVMLGGEEDDRARFLQEARAAAALQHPGIVQVHEVGEDGGVPFIALQFVDGAPPKDPAPRRAAEIVRDVARAIQHAHDHGIVHRDLKPGNILVDAAGRAYVTDFGLARQVTSQARLTVSGTVVGTPAFMPPEQARGETGAAGPLCDVYSLGATLYALLAGREPFSGAHLYDVLVHVIESDPEPLRRRNARIHPDLERVVLKAMEKDPARRFPTAGALADDLDRFLAGEPVTATPPSLSRRIARVVRRRLPVLVPVLVLALTGALAAVWAAYRPGRLVVRSGLAGLRVDVDGRTASSFPLIVAAGEHVVRVSAPDHEPLERRLVVGRGETVELDARLERSTGVLEIDTDPPAVAIIDGVRYGTPLKDLRLPTGRHVVWLEAEGRARATFEIEIRRSETARRFATLPPCLGWEVVRADSGAVYSLGDLNSDGAPDFGLLAYGMRVETLSGVDGATLGQKVVSGGIMDAPLLEDVDRDGGVEFVSPVFAGDRWQIAAWSAKAGGPLWIRDDVALTLSTYAGRPYAPVPADLDGDGTRDAILQAGGLIAIRSTDGTTLWRSPSREVANVTPLPDADGDGVGDLVAAEPERVRALSGRTGRELWTREGVFAFCWPGAVVMKDAQGAAWIELATGVERGRWTTELPVRGSLLPWRPSDRSAPWAIHHENDRLSLWDLERGTAVWSRSHPSPPWSMLDIDGDGRPLALLAGEDRLEAVAADGRTKWSLAGRARAQPLLSDGELTIGLDSRLVRVDASSGAMRWSIDLPSPLYAPPAEADYDHDGRVEVFAGTESGHLLALTRDGAHVFSVRGPYLRSLNFADTDLDGLLDVWGVSSGAAVIRAPKILWRRDSPHPLRAGATLLDVNGDGVPDVLLPRRSRDRFEVVGLDGRTGRQLWAAPVHHDMIRAAPLADVDGDGRPELIVADTSTGLRALDPATGRVLRSTAVARHGYAEIAAGDLDGDDVPDFVVSHWLPPYWVTALSGRTFDVLWERRSVSSCWRGAAIDSSGSAPRVFVADQSGRVARLDGRTGDVAWETTLASVSRPSVCCVNLGQSVLLVGSESGSLVGLDRDTGTELWRLSLGSSGPPPVAAELRDRTYVVSPALTGLVCFTDRLEVAWQFAADAPTSRPVIADLDADGAPEVVAACGRSLVCLDLATGRLRWRVAFAESIEARPAVADFDGDGILDVLVAGRDRSVTAVSGRGRLAGR